MKRQQYNAYTESDFFVWKTLFNKQMDEMYYLLPEAYLKGVAYLNINADEVPRFEDINEKLYAKTGWKIHVVPGMIDQPAFFSLLSQKLFPCSTWLRKPEQLDYLQEPDMFHDVFGHVPLLTHQPFADFVQWMSELAVRHLAEPDVVKFITRLYWFTVEFGLIREANKLKVFGAGLISSAGESRFAVGDRANRETYNLPLIFLTDYFIDQYQEVYYEIEGFEQLLESGNNELLALLERGKLLINSEMVA